MIESFSILSEEEYNKLQKAITWITILIAGADGIIDDKEIEWAEKLTSIRAYQVPEQLKEYYQKAGEDFNSELQEEIEKLPKDTGSRTRLLSQYLSELNPIMAKLDNETGALLYDSFLSFGKHVAKSSGGFLRFFSISQEEKELLNLEMLDPIIHDTEA